MKSRLAAVVSAILMLCRCGGSPASPTAPVADTSVSSQPDFGAPDAVLVGAGDIADCKLPGASLTAQLLDRTEGIVFTTGDNAYPSGSAEHYRDCYAPTWGRHRDRTRPSLGNHEMESNNAQPYYEYFGGNAGPPGLGYYSYAAGAWHIVVLNSEIPTGSGSPQGQWLRADLQSHPTRCTAAYWHRPRFSSGSHGSDLAMQDLWRTLYEFKVDVVINGHDHLYERFSPQDPYGAADPVNGIREFVVGTGGGGLNSIPGGAQPNSEMQARVWGVLMLVLRGDDYRWQFISVDGSTGDGGQSSCH